MSLTNLKEGPFHFTLDIISFPLSKQDRRLVIVNWSLTFLFIAATLGGGGLAAGRVGTVFGEPSVSSVLSSANGLDLAGGDFLAARGGGGLEAGGGLLGGP